MRRRSERPVPVELRPAAASSLYLDGLYPIGYNAPVIEIRQTDHYAAWFDRLRGRQARARILTSKLRWNWREHFRSRHEQNSNEIVGCGRASEER